VAGAVVPDGTGLEPAHSVAFSGIDVGQFRLFAMAEERLGDRPFGIVKDVDVSQRRTGVVCVSWPPAWGCP
jgi:hypothetical protein